MQASKKRKDEKCQFCGATARLYPLIKAVANGHIRMKVCKSCLILLT